MKKERQINIFFDKNKVESECRRYAKLSISSDWILAINIISFVFAFISLTELNVGKIYTRLQFSLFFNDKNSHIYCLTLPNCNIFNLKYIVLLFKLKKKNSTGSLIIWIVFNVEFKWITIQNWICKCCSEKWSFKQLLELVVHNLLVVQ